MSIWMTRFVFGLNTMFVHLMGFCFWVLGLIIKPKPREWAKPILGLRHCSVVQNFIKKMHFVRVFRACLANTY